jgi:hypothetical protein
MASVRVIYEAFTPGHPNVTRLLLDHGADLVTNERQDLFPPFSSHLEEESGTATTGGSGEKSSSIAYEGPDKKVLTYLLNVLD